MIRCSYALCKTGLPGIVIPVAQFRPLNSSTLSMPAGHAVISELRLCEECALTADIHQIIDNKRWQDICDQIARAGGPPPDRDSLMMILGSPKGQLLPKYLQDAFARRPRHHR